MVHTEVDVLEEEGWQNNENYIRLFIILKIFNEKTKCQYALQMLKLSVIVCSANI